MCPLSANSPQAVKSPVPVHLVPFQVPFAAARRTSKHRRLDPRTPGDVAASCATLSCGGIRSAATHHTTREITIRLMSAIFEKAVLLGGPQASPVCLSGKRNRKMEMNVGRRWNGSLLTGENKVPGDKHLFQCHFICQKSHIILAAEMK